MATVTPWGKSDSAVKLGVGIMKYTTPSHGGIHLSKKKNALVPEYMRNTNGWYEEDSDWAICATVFPDVFTEATGGNEVLAIALEAFMNWNPDAYELYYKDTVKTGESIVRDRETFARVNKDSYVVTSAIDSKTHPGMVECWATKGGKRNCETGQNFLVPSEQYAARSRFGFVVNPNEHENVSAF